MAKKDNEVITMKTMSLAIITGIGIATIVTATVTLMSLQSASADSSLTIRIDKNVYGVGEPISFFVQARNQYQGSAFPVAFIVDGQNQTVWYDDDLTPNGSKEGMNIYRISEDSQNVPMINKTGEYSLFVTYGGQKAYESLTVTKLVSENGMIHFYGPYEGLDNETGIVQVANQTYYMMTLQGAPSAHVHSADNTVVFHDVYFTFPGCGLCPTAPVSFNPPQDLKIQFPDNTVETLAVRDNIWSTVGMPIDLHEYFPNGTKIFPNGTRGTWHQIQHRDQIVTTLTSHTEPQAGITVTHDSVKFLVSTTESSSYQSVLAQNSSLFDQSFCSQHFDHGPTLAVTIGKDQCENPSHHLSYNGGKIVVSNMINKTIFKTGENIAVTPQLTNIGGHNFTINYCGPLFVTLAVNHSGDIVWPRYAWGCPLIPQQMILPPNRPTGGDSYGQNIVLHNPGNYAIISLATFGNIPNATVLWSEPTKITIVPEDYVENKTEYGNNSTNTNLQASIQNCTEPYGSGGNNEIEEMREKVKSIGLADPRVQNILDGKPCEFMAFDMVGFRASPSETLNTYPEIHINVNGTAELSAVVDLNKSSVVGLSTAPLHRLGGTVDPYSSMWYMFAGASVSTAAAISVFILRKKK